MKQFDLRSDTVTQPSKEMLNAMMIAPTGDDVFGEDPTINKLEAHAAELFGMEAGLFCPSGTMTNQIAINVHTTPGSEVICSSLAHIYWYEGGGMAKNSQSQARLIGDERGMFSANEVSACINPDDVHAARTSLVALENTSNKGGGAIWKDADVKAIAAVCQTHQLPLHLDGARIFNALVASNSSPLAWGKMFDSISICLSKGLGAPVGSVLLGSRSFIKEARRVRKSFGGGMRQAGIIAAAGLYALEKNIDRLQEDHSKAQAIETAFVSLFGRENVLPAETNLVICKAGSPEKAQSILGQWKQKGLLGVSMGGDKIRLVTHLNVEGEDMQAILTIINQTEV